MFPFPGEVDPTSLAQLITTLIIGATCVLNCLIGPRFGG